MSELDMMRELRMEAFMTFEMVSSHQLPESSLPESSETSSRVSRELLAVIPAALFRRDFAALSLTPA